ncbi:MAG: purine-nucleoside phosphorylase [Ahrensia sp.]|nr:purine-nucleoside phosphorylase [Ahrensia sp.]
MTTLPSALNGFVPETALVLGSGLGSLVEAVDAVHRIDYDDLDGFPPSGVSGHAGELVAGHLSDQRVVVMSGRVHYYEHGDAAAMRAPLEALKAAGVRRIILTNSAGSIDSDMPPGSVMQIEDHINFSGSNPLIGEPSDARFVGLTNAYDEAICSAFAEAADELSITLHKGVYMWFSGPCFETPAEIKMARLMGADAVGMSTVPEVILSRFLGLDVAALSVITNFAAGMTGDELSHQETKDMAPKGGERLAKLIATVLEKGFA